VTSPRPRDGERLRVGIIGCGDVARRWYVPTLAKLTDRVELVACCDQRRDAAERLAADASAQWPAVASFDDPATMVTECRPDAVFNLTPAPVHAQASAACLQEGVAVYSEKPLAGSLADANRLIELASQRGVLLLCAPGEAVSARVRWMSRIVASGRLGRLTLVVAQHADTGPATWREYTGDPRVFYGPGVGPVFDHGVYRLHAMTALLGPVRKVQAMGTIANPRRVIRAGPLAGQAFDVTSPDHVLMNLEFANGALGQLLASFAAASTQAPWLEMHFTHGTLSYGGRSWEEFGPASIYFDDDTTLGLEGWIGDLRPPDAERNVGVVEAGIEHFIACLRGEETPVLTAEHARHVLDIILKGYQSIADGGTHETETTF
jgi:predicted dehydrogenase